MRDWNLERTTRLETKRKSHQLAINDATSDMIVTLDVDGFLTSLNSAGFDLLGLDRSKEISKYRMASFYDEDCAAQFISEELPNAIHHGVWVSETVIVSKDGDKIPSSQVLIAHKDQFENVTFFSLILRDIRPIKEAERERQQLLTQLHQTEKLETIGRLAGGITHDFNNILTVIMGYAELGLADKTISEDDEEILGNILNAAEKAARLSNQVLDFSSLQIIKPQILNLNEVVSDSHFLLERVMGEEIAIKSYLDPHLWPINMDRTQLEQIILNLAVNARDALDSNGQFTLKTQNVALSKAEAKELELKEGEEFVLLEVVDSGLGISPDILEYIFEPFYTTKELGKGTGLGLSVVYGAIKQNDGHITVESNCATETGDDVSGESSTGTVFKIYLPRVKDTENSQSNSNVEIGYPLCGEGETVLLVEDDPEVRMLLVRILSGLNYVVLEAKNSSVAMDIFIQNINKIDLVISDIVMPKMDGLDLTQALQEIKPEIKILLVSGHTDRIEVMQQFKNDDVKLLTKPFTSEKLAHITRKMLGRSDQLLQCSE